MPVHMLLTEALARVPDIRLHQGKTKVWNKVGRVPEDVHELGLEAWQSEGLVVLGTPMDTLEFVSDAQQDRGGAPTLGDHSVRA